MINTNPLCVCSTVCTDPIPILTALGMFIRDRKVQQKRAAKQITVTIIIKGICLLWKLYLSWTAPSRTKPVKKTKCKVILFICVLLKKAFDKPKSRNYPSYIYMKNFISFSCCFINYAGNRNFFKFFYAWKIPLDAKYS